MPTHRSLSILAIALAQIIVVANARFERGLYLLDAPENINPDDLYNEMKYADSRGGYIESWPWSKEFQDIAMQKGSAEKNLIPAETLKAIEEDARSVETPGEPLPIPLALTNNIKAPAFKKTGLNYYMSLCHFKICNMGRKRNTRYLHLPDIAPNAHSGPHKLDNSIALNAM